MQHQSIEEETPVPSFSGKRLVWNLFSQPHSRTTLPPNIALLVRRRFPLGFLVFYTWLLVRSDVPQCHIFP